MVTVLEMVRDAQNDHDAGRMAALFAEDYRSSQPVHPNRRFAGSAQVLTNWTTLFEGIPDFRAELVASATDGDTEWAEWDWRGTRSDGSPFSMRGVMIATVRGGLVVEARLYMEPVEDVGDDIEAVVRDLAEPSGGSS
jgi:ketosteroid isomerase-like protein